jgi:hypothetical protein
MLPSSITNMFSNDERQRFTTTQENVSEDEVIDQVSCECCHYIFPYMKFYIHHNRKSFKICKLKNMSSS